MKLLIVTIVLALGQFAFAGTIGSTVKVNGMVCSFCVNSIEKKFKEKSEVSEVKVDLDTKTVAIKYATDKQLTDEQIKDVIVKSGYTVVSIEHQKTTTPTVAEEKAATPKASEKIKGSKN